MTKLAARYGLSYVGLAKITQGRKYYIEKIVSYGKSTKVILKENAGSAKSRIYVMIHSRMSCVIGTMIMLVQHILNRLSLK